MPIGIRLFVIMFEYCAKAIRTITCGHCGSYLASKCLQEPLFCRYLLLAAQLLPPASVTHHRKLLGYLEAKCLIERIDGMPALELIFSRLVSGKPTPQQKWLKEGLEEWFEQSPHE